MQSFADANSFLAWISCYPYGLNSWYFSYFGQDFIDIQQNNPLNEALLEQLAAISGVDYLTAYCGASVEIPEIGEQEPFNVRGLTEQQMVGMYYFSYKF